MSSHDHRKLAKRGIKGWELRHLSRRAAQFGLAREEQLLINIGWRDAGSDTEVPAGSELHSALTRLAIIPGFARTCHKEECETCRYLVDEYSYDESHTQERWALQVEPYRWQKEAAKAWFENSGSGIVKVVTGAGKTILALSLISELMRSRAYKRGGLRIVVVVPTTALLDQWHEEIRYLLELDDNDIANYYAAEKQPLYERPIAIYVLASAARHLPEHVQQLGTNEDLLLIVDECHRSGSPVFSKIYNTSPTFTLGLSATPERRGDFGFEETLIPELGPIIYEYGYDQARRDGIIPPFRLKRIAVQLKAYEAERYEAYSEDIRELYRRLLSRYPQLKSASGELFLKVLGKLQRDTEDPLIEKYTTLLNLRKAIVHTSKSKMEALAWIVENELTTTTKTLVFHERISSADEIFTFLEKRGLAVARYHSDLQPAKRKRALRDYREGRARIIVACTALDEGLDVPATSAGIIVAATSSIRQHVQRIGRILRRAPGKDHSLVYSVFVQGIEDGVFTDDVMQELEKAAERVEYISLL